MAWAARENSFLLAYRTARWKASCLASSMNVSTGAAWALRVGVTLNAGGASSTISSALQSNDAICAMQRVRQGRHSPSRRVNKAHLSTQLRSCTHLCHLTWLHLWRCTRPPDTRGLRCLPKKERTPERHEVTGFLVKRQKCGSILIYSFGKPKFSTGKH